MTEEGKKRYPQARHTGMVKSTPKQTRTVCIDDGTKHGTYWDQDLWEHDNVETV